MSTPNAPTTPSVKRYNSPDSGAATPATPVSKEALSTTLNDCLKKARGLDIKDKAKLIGKIAGAIALLTE